MRCATMRIEMQKMRLARLSERLPAVFSLVKVKREAHLDALDSRLITSVRQFFDRQTHRLDMLGQRAAALDPKLLLSRGYSITIHNGKAVRDKDTLKPGDEIETIFEKGTVKSIVQ